MPAPEMPQNHTAAMKRGRGEMALMLIQNSPATPAIISASGQRATYRFVEFFTAQIRNPNTRRAYVKAVGDFCVWLEDTGILSIEAVKSIHVATYVELLGREHAAPTVKLRLAAIRMMFDWLATGGIIPFNPAAAVRGPKYSIKRGKTAVLASDEARELLDAIDVSKPVGLRDRALIGLMVYSFARVGAALSMRVEDVYVQNRRLWVRLHEKGGKRHDMPCHHNLEEYLLAYIEQCGLKEDTQRPLFCTIARGKDALSTTPLPQANAYAMIQRRALQAKISTKIGNHTFRATGITAYLKNGGTLERAAIMANHASTRTTQLYDRRSDDITLDEVERVLI
jgi:integrase/recombinase XerD